MLNTFYPPTDGTETEGYTFNDIKVENGIIFLRAERNSSGNGRKYVITYRFVDDSGNIHTVSADVIVPHDNS
jgi:hypothetical protein